MSPKRTLSETDLDYIVSHTAYKDREALRAQFTNFLARHPDGYIGKKDFRGMMRACFPEKHGKQMDTLEKRIFNMYDENRDGHISFSEFMVVMYVLSNGTPEDNLKQIFRIFDADADGSISLKELKKVVNDIFHLLSNEDKETCKNKAALTLSAFKEMDTNADGMITEKEFLDAIMAQEKMATLLTLKIAQVFDPDAK
jgi:Ca2+-binding EF-hand superfamily protein